MFNGGNGISLADIAAVAGNRNGLGNGGDGLWALIIILALFGGFGENGGGLLGNRGGSSSTTAAIDASLQRGFDTQSIVSKLDGISNGICSLGYDQLAQMNTINQNISQTGYNVQNSIQQLAIAGMQQNFASQTQLQNCCCNIENLLAQANYNRQADTCAITNAINQAAQNIMLNDNQNYRQLHDEQVALQMQGKDAQIAQLTAALNKCDAQAIAANAVQSAVCQLKPPTPEPAYLVPNPNAVYINGNCGWNNGGCCGNNFGWNVA